MRTIHVLRKPCSEPTVAANVLKWGTGALNVDGCRIGTDAGWNYPNGRGGEGWHGRSGLSSNLDVPMASTAGRWPANVILEEGPAPEALDRQSGDLSSRATRTDPARKMGEADGITLDFMNRKVARKEYLSENGGASRFFQHVHMAKADR